MKQVDVIINLPAIRFNKLYSYSVPPEMESIVQPGKRILVELGNKQVEAIVAAPVITSQRYDLKPVITVLDYEPALSCKQMDFAHWISDTYLCPLSLAVNQILGVKKRSIEKHIKAKITREEYKALPAPIKSQAESDLLELLWRKGEIALAKLKNNENAELIHKLQLQDMITITGNYRGNSKLQDDCHYRLNDKINYDDMVRTLQKRAPQQFKVINLLHMQEAMEYSELRKIVNYSSLKALIQKDYIIKIPPRTHHTVRSFELNTEQKQAVNNIRKRTIAGKHAEMLLYGITGSGKTEVYIEAARAVIADGRKVIVLVPEIALTRHQVRIFSERFQKMAVMHSGMAKGERLRQWQKIENGEVDIVLGTRSAVFAPLNNIGLIVVDEEQENTYKQEETPRYHAREVAAFRARQENAVLLLGSATPSIESFHLAMKGVMELIALDQRAGDALLPKVTVVDLKNCYREGNYLLSNILIEKIQEVLGRGEQIILFLNRRGYTPVTVCMDCGNTIICPNCSVALNYHRDINRNVCHYCNYSIEPPQHCPSCNSMHLRQSGMGTQKIEEVIRSRFPDARVMRLDLDSSRKKGSQDNILKMMRQHKIDILIGTQMVAKGLDFPEVSLVGIVDADGILNLPDFRAAERCFQLIVQAAGRAGRANIPGEVVIQTYNPENSVIQMAAHQDYFAFYQSEIINRETLHYPPFTNLLRLVVSSVSDDRAQSVCQKLASYIREITDANEEYIELLGPAPCWLTKIRNRYRYQLIIKCDSLLLITSIAKYIIYSNKPEGIKIEVELNPLSTV